MFRQSGAITAVSVTTAVIARSPAQAGIMQAHVFLVFAAICCSCCRWCGWCRSTTAAGERTAARRVRLRYWMIPNGGGFLWRAYAGPRAGRSRHGVQPDSPPGPKALRHAW